ncbi:MAG: transcription antitermination factor NusB [Gemmatimonadales bacterium]
MLRRESRERARALQLLYAWDTQGQPDFGPVAENILHGHGRRGREWEGAERTARRVVGGVQGLDAQIAEVADAWRLERLGVIEKNILRLGLMELEAGATPAPVVIDEALRLAHWFAGDKAPPFVNGVLDTLARRLGRL